jgi:plastocyanin
MVSEHDLLGGVPTIRKLRSAGPHKSAVIGWIAKPIIIMALSCLAVACTAGGIPISSGGGGGVTINVSLSQFAPMQTAYGQSGGFSPAVTTVSVGTRLHFVSMDNFCCHTATLIPGATSFPNDPHFSFKAAQQTGSTLSGGFSSGALQPSASSQTITADQPGTYLYGCFFHYGAPMRGAIVVQ